ncbi:TonB-dependent receptor [Cyclobacterium sp. SYSU L10401]|uniref:TonB-dependent receptor n=1 Tax=Cyclobacterium sp. SYSU L10401 TaxID=2678657 RepID=UPI001F092811|nr:TonB-dependent receptor [Cyclobacterium sp. SYSU L10401]
MNSIRLLSSNRMSGFGRCFLAMIFSVVSCLHGFSITTPENGRQIVIQGTVKSDEGEPIPYANIQVIGTVKGTLTAVDGSFKIFDLENGDYTLKISAIGFKPIYKEIAISGGEAQELNLFFEEIGVEMPLISVISNKDRVFSRVPGSVSYIDEKEIRTIQPISGNEVLRRSPGVHVVDEEGLGMRVNIGIRGLNPDRSRSVLVMEDSVPVALAPYGEPEMYYSPAIDRMAGIEILIGSGQILYGPQTIGGVVNYITASPPLEEEGAIRIQGGQGGFFSGLLNYGNTFGNTGVQVNLLRKRADDIGPTSFDITDLNAKFLFDTGAKSELGMKVGVYDESSNSTYIGLNQVMYDQGGMDFTRLAPDDRLGVSRYSLSFSHQYRISEKIKLRSIAYGYKTTRNWNRQDFSINNDNQAPSDWTGVMWGDMAIPGGAIFMRDGTGNRNREFEVVGFEPRLEVAHDLFDLENDLIFGARILYERAFEQRINGTKAGVKSGDLVEDEVRTGHAFSAYAQNKINLTEKFELSAGLRMESFNYARDIFRRNFPEIGIRDTSLLAQNNIMEVIPGLGFNYRPLQHINVYGGIHKGYAPPRTKDAITSTGDVLDLEAEKSWNFELGFRAEPSSWMYLEMTGFRMDFSNQIIPVSESSGGMGFGVVNGGATLHQGVESAFLVDLSRLFSLKRTKLNYDLNLAYVNAIFSEDRFKGESNIKGNRTPYAPEWMINSALTFETNEGLLFRLGGNYVGNQFTDEVNSIEPSANGRSGKIASYVVLDGMLAYQVSQWNSRFNISVKNLANERYIASRRPQGIRVGLPRLITLGYEYKF